MLDKYEMYSFTTYLYFYGFFYLYIFEQPLLYAILSTIFSNIIFYQVFNFNSLSVMCHNYWKYNLNTVAVPQLLSCISNIIIYKKTFSTKSIIIISPSLHILFHYIINVIYKKELLESKNLRFIITMLFIFSALIL